MKLALNSKKVFLTVGMKLSSEEKIDIILSPEFYWVRIFNIPVKYVSQARKIVPNFYEDIIGDVIDEISYMIIKIEEHKFLCFAYDNKKIYQAISDTGINIMNINRVYFAQTECIDFKDFFIDDKTFFYTEDNILVKAPKNSINSENNISENLDKIKLSPYNVDIRFYNKIISTKQIYFILVIFLIISTINFVKSFEYSKELKNIENEKEKLRAENNLPSSSIQIDTIINEKSALISKELKKRELLEYLLSNSNFKSFKMKKNEINLLFTNEDKKIIDALISMKYKIIDTNVINGNQNIRIEL